MNSMNKNEKVLHGNRAKVEPNSKTKKISPLLDGNPLSDYHGIRSPFSRSYSRVGLPDFDEEMCKREVDEHEM